MSGQGHGSHGLSELHLKVEGVGGLPGGREWCELLRTLARLGAEYVEGPVTPWPR